jgi:hypothetical protein
MFIKDIIPKEELDVLKSSKTQSEIIAIAKAKLKEQKANQQTIQSKVNNTPKSKFSHADENTFSNNLVAGTAEASARGVAFVDNITNQFEVSKDWISNDFASNNTEMLDYLEKRKKKISQKDLTPQRLENIKKLEEENSNAKGFTDNVVAGAKQLYDTATHPKEWTTQGMIAGVMPTDPANALSFATGGVGGKIITSTLGKIGFGIADGVAVNSLVEYNVAKGTGKSDEEAKKIAVQSGVAGAIPSTAFATAGAFKGEMGTKLSRGKVLTADEKAIKENPIKNDILKISNDFKNNNPLFDGDIIDEHLKEQSATNIANENMNHQLSLIHEAEQKSKATHEETKINLEKMYNNGATLDEMVAYKNNVPLTSSDETTSKIINDGELPSNDLAGFKIVNVIEDNIRLKSLTPDELYTKLREKNIKQPLAKIASQSYKERNTDILVEYISNKTSEHLQTSNENYKNQVLQKIDIHNKQIIADEKAWSSSPTKLTLDSLIKDEIGEDNINQSQKDMVYELNKLGLVQDVKSENIKQKYNEKANGVYDKSNNEISIDNTMSKLDKAQTITHEYIHSATTKLLHHKPFNDEVISLMNSAKNQSKNKKHYGFKSPDEFIAEAFSDPYFAKELNDMSLTKDMKKKYGAKEHIKSVWDLIVDKFSEVVYLATGKKFKINKDSYFDALNKTLGKQIQELEQIKSDRTFSGESLKQIQNENPKVTKASDFDNLKLHPRFDELIDMRKDVKATDIKYDKKVVSKGTVVHDKDKFGGVDNTFVVPTSYEKNYNADFVLTSQDIKNIKNGKINDEIVMKLEQDLHTLDNNPDYIISKDVDIKQSKSLLGDEFNDNYYVNKQGEIVKDGELLFQGYSKEQKEKRGIYNVQFNDKKSTRISKDIALVDRAIKFEKGFEHPNKKTGRGALHIKKHIGNDKDGWVTKEEVIKMGEFIRNIEPYESKGKNIYEFYGDDGTRFRIIVGKNKKENVISFYSNRKVGIENNTLTYIYSNSSTNKDNGTTLGQPSSLDKKIIAQKTKKNQDILFSKKEALKQEKTLWEKYENSVDKVVDTLFEKGLMQTAELLAFPIKATTDAMTLGKFDIQHKNWFTVTDTQKAVNEVVNDFNNMKTQIYTSASDLRKSLEHLNKEQNVDLLKVLNGDMELKDLGDDLKPLYKTFRKQIDKNANELVSLGILKEDEKIKDYVKRYYKKYLEDSGEIKAIKSKAFKKFYKRKDLDYDTRVQLGMIEDAGLVIANTMAEQKSLIAKAKVLKQIANKFAKDEEVDGYVRISDETVKDGVKKWGALAGKYVPTEIQKELLQSRIIASELRYWEDIQYGLVDHIKVNVTVKNPATHVYNIGSNISLSFIAGDMVALGKTIKMMVAKPNEFKALVKKANNLGLDSFLDDIENPMIELHKNSKKTNIALTIAKNLYMTQDSKVGKNIRKLYDWEDKIFKLARFKKLLDKGMNEKEAFKDAMATYVDYKTPVPAGLRWLDKAGLMPFLHYQYKATPQVAKLIAKNPIKSLILGTGIASIGGLRWQDEDDKYYKPDWMGNKTIGNQFLTKEWVKVGNSGYYWNIGRLIPGTKFDFDFGGFVKGLMYISDGRSPLGYEVVKDGEDYEYLKKLRLLTKNYTPPLTYGRYGQRIIDIGLGKTDIIDAPKNPVTKNPDTIKDIALRGVGIRPTDRKKEFKKHYKKAKKENDKDTIKKLKGIEPSFNLGNGRKSSSGFNPSFNIKF